MSHRVKTLSQVAFVCLIAVSSAPTFAAGNPAAAVDLLGRCVACHGADGIGKAPQYPNLRGQKAAYLEKSLKGFRSGERKDANMSAMAKGLTDTEIADLAAYFSAID
jgi:cytochrome c553